MKPRRTPTSNKVFTLPGGNEDADLWVETGEQDGYATITSVWELTEAERARIVLGANIELTVWALATPPVALSVTTQALGKDGNG